MNLTLTPTEPPKPRREHHIRYTPHHAGGGE